MAVTISRRRALSHSGIFLRCMAASRRGLRCACIFAAAALSISAVACGPLKGLAQHGHLVPGSLTIHRSTTVPFTLSGNRIYIKAVVGRTPYAFIFDTGGTAILVPEVQRDLKFPVISSVHVVGLGASEQDANLVRVPMARVGTARYGGGPFVVISVPGGVSPLPGLRFGGVLGREFFMSLVTVIDYEKSTLTFYEPGSFRPDATAVALPLVVTDGHARVLCSIDGHSGNFDIDTGSAQGLTVTKMFAESAGLMEDFSRTSDAVIGHGVGGVVTGTVGRAKTFACGPLLMSGPVVGVAHSDSGVFAQPDVAGNIGGAIWRRFKVALDVPNSKFYLIPNARFADAFTFNRAGLFSERNGEIEKVILVAPASPAAQAGVLAGDTISNIDGIAVTHLSHDNVTATWLRPVGTRIILGLRRDGKPVSVSLALRDLL